MYNKSEILIDPSFITIFGIPAEFRNRDYNYNIYFLHDESSGPRGEYLYKYTSADAIGDDSKAYMIVGNQEKTHYELINYDTIKYPIIMFTTERNKVPFKLSVIIIGNNISGKNTINVINGKVVETMGPIGTVKLNPRFDGQRLGGNSYLANEVSSTNSNPNTNTNNNGSNSSWLANPINIALIIVVIAIIVLLFKSMNGSTKGKSKFTFVQ